MDRVCQHCGKIMVKPLTKSRKDWENRSKYCSKKCMYTAHKGKHFAPSTELKKGHSEIPGRVVALPRDEKHHQWKGNKVGYGALHSWVQRRLGTPQECWQCGTTEKRRYQWSNTSREYKRELSDWRRLCIPCHKKYDRTKIKDGAKSVVLF